LCRWFLSRLVRMMRRVRSQPGGCSEQETRREWLVLRPSLVCVFVGVTKWSVPVRFSRPISVFKTVIGLEGVSP